MLINVPVKNILGKQISEKHSQDYTDVIDIL